MTTYGLTPTGFVPKTLEIIVDGINADLKEFFNYSPDGKNGILSRFVGIIGAAATEVWELAEAINSSQDPDKSSGDALAALCLLTGTFKIEAQASTVDLTLTGLPTTLIPATSRASAGADAVFLLNQDVTLATLPAWTTATAYLVNDRVTNNLRAYICTTAGTSAGSGGPTTTDDDITDGTVHWQYLGEGTGAGDGSAIALTTGPTIAVAGTLTTIDTPVGGWQSVTNLLDARVGFDTQTDESLRVTREEELSQSGTGTTDAIRAEVLSLDGVTSVKVFHNDTDVTDIDGLPGHSVEVMVRGGDDALIAEALAKQIPDGIGTHGDVTVSVTDSEGLAHDISFSRPDEINIGVKITLVKDPATYPADGDTQVKLAIVTFGNSQKSGKDAVSSSIQAQAFKVPGVLDVTACLISSIASPGTPLTPTVSTTIAISPRQLTVFDTSWITVITSNGTP